jgi:gephyrin
VRLLEAVEAHQHVRAVGSDVKEGQLLFPSGTVVHAAEVGLLVSQGIRSVQVRRRPVVGVLSSGDELVDPSSAQPPPPGHIVDSNRLMLKTLITEVTGAEVVDLAIARDSVTSLTSILSPDVLTRLDALVTTGGVSMGELDLIKAFLASSANVLFGRLSMKPGKPTTFALLPRPDNSPLPVFALPGNPVSADGGEGGQRG